MRELVAPTLSQEMPASGTGRRSRASPMGYHESVLAFDDMMLRYFCRVAPGEMGDIGYRYLVELRRLSIATRALPIGPAAALGFERRWYDISSSFTVPMVIPFVNIVCAPLGMLMG